MDEEKAHVEVVLRRGEEVLLSVSDDDRREDIRRKLILLQTRYKVSLTFTYSTYSDVIRFVLANDSAVMLCYFHNCYM